MFNDNILKCPICDKQMVERYNGTTGERFYGCSDFPNCRGTRNKEEGEGKIALIPTRVYCARCQKPRDLDERGLCPECQSDWERY